jgi:hypothetical protein
LTSQEEGPPLETLTRRLAECPADFLAEPRAGAHGVVRVAAVVSDLIVDLGGAPLTHAQAETFKRVTPQAQRNRLGLVLITCWLLDDPWFRAQGRFAADALALLSGGLDVTAKVVSAEKFISDPDRREELARLALNGIGLRPAGESAVQAADRLTTLNSAERQLVVKAAQAAEERARKIREAIALRKAAAEADAKAIRE